MWYEEYPEQIHAIINAAHKFYSLRYQMSDGGNLSVRVPGRDCMIVKGTNISFEEVAVENLVMTDYDGKVIHGRIAPSKEALLHGALYRSFTEVEAIMHCHSVYATAWAAHHDALAFATYHSALKFSGDVPVIDTQSYAVPKSCFSEIIARLRENSDSCAFLLRGHGQVTMAENMRKAAYLAELVEETAAIAAISEFGK